jgi:vancomycin resistance protein VanJ
MSSNVEPDQCDIVAERLATKQPRPIKASSWFVRAATLWCAWLYVLAVCAEWLLILLGGDRWWFATVVLFGPRWLLAIPLVLLLPLVAAARRRMLGPVLLSCMVLVGPIMGLCLPLGKAAAPGAPSLRVLTCNVDGNHVDLAAFWRLIKDFNPDIVALQECPEDLKGNWGEEWHVHSEGELLMASRHPLVDVALAQDHPASPPPVNVLYRAVETPAGRVGFCNVHFPSPGQDLSIVLDRQTLVNSSRSDKLSTKIDDRLIKSKVAAQWLEQFPEPLIIAGDFNMPTDSMIYRQNWAKYANAFSSRGFGFGYTKWTPVGGLLYGLRIDHILIGKEYSCRSCWVGPDIGSDHLPVLAELTWQ